MNSPRHSFYRNLSVIMVACAAVGFAGFTWTNLPAADEKSDEPVHFMRKKLEDSSKILEGLTLNDADMIKKATENLLKVTRSDMWNAITDTEYFEFNSEFRSSLRKLDQAATAKNLDNALIQWNDVTKSCIECHKYIREARIKLKSK